MRFIGDVHGKFKQYRNIAEASPDGISIQVGDFGIGFPNPDYSSIQNMNNGQYHYYIRGNHDNPEVCKTLKTEISPIYLPDGKICYFTPPSKKCYEILFIGGANSIDKNLRVEGVDWWRDEEISMSQFDDILDRVEHMPPFDIVVSHECPESVASIVDGHYNPTYWPSFTRRALQHILEINRPQMWFHGHWHTQKSFVHEGTQFHSLGELEWVDII